MPPSLLAIEPHPRALPACSIVAPHGRNIWSPCYAGPHPACGARRLDGCSPCTTLPAGGPVGASSSQATEPHDEEPVAPTVGSLKVCGLDGKSRVYGERVEPRIGLPIERVGRTEFQAL